MATSREIQLKNYLKNRLGPKTILSQKAIKAALPKVPQKTMATEAASLPLVDLFFVSEDSEKTKESDDLLNKIIEAMGFEKSKIYVAGAEKLSEVKPKVVVALGSKALKAITGQDVELSSVRGTFINHNGILIMPTYHPTHLLKNPSDKKLVWDDMKKIMARK